MILTNRLFERREPDRTAKTIYIFCDGKVNEYKYFCYFAEKDSRLRIIVNELDAEEDNSPLGLLSIATSAFDDSESERSSKYTFIDGDEVWFVMDIDKDRDDSRGPQIREVIAACEKNEGWNYAISNPCFEVWQYYHQHTDLPKIPEIGFCKNWKTHLNSAFKGGFDNRRHPIYIENATLHAKLIYKESDGLPELARTGVYRLGESILALMKGEIDRIIMSHGLLD